MHGDKLLDFVLALITKVDNERDNVFIIGATNNFKALDSALTRSGRLSKHIKFDLPDEKGIEHIYNIYAAKKPIDKNLDKSALFQKLYGIKVSGADIRYIMNEAHFFGYERAGIEEKMDKDTYSGKDLHSFRIIQEDFDKAIQKFIETRNGTDTKPIGFNR